MVARDELLLGLGEVERAVRLRDPGDEERQADELRGDVPERAVLLRDDALVSESEPAIRITPSTASASETS